MTLPTGQKKENNEFVTLGKKGFTLIELGLVIAIISIILLVSAADFKRLFSRLEMEAAGWRLLSLLNYAKSESITRGLEFEVSIDRETGFYRAGPAGGMPAVSGTLARSVRISGITEGPAVFRPDGTAVPFKVTMENEGKNRISLEVMPYSGRTVLSEE